MKKITKLAVLLILVGTILNSCTKFEDGPGFSLSSKKARLANTWEIETIFDPQGNEISFTEMMNSDSIADSSEFDMEISTVKFTFEKDETLILAMGISFFGFTTEIQAPGTWKFVGDTGLEVTIESDEVTGIEGSVTSYNILRLANKELWLEYTSEVSAETYEIHLIPAE